MLSRISTIRLGRFALLSFLISSLLLLRVLPADAVTVIEFPVPESNSSLPISIASGPDGNLWFTEPAANKIGRITTGVPDGTFFAAIPCRVLDTRNPTALLGGPALVANSDRSFTVVGQCGIPVGARAISANVTVTGGTDAGDLRAYPGGTALPLVSAVNYGPGQTRANNAVLRLGVAGNLTVRCDQAFGTVDLILDVNGYFF